MNIIEEQRQLIDKLYWLVRASLRDEFDTVSCWFDYKKSQDGSISINSRLSFMHNGNTQYGLLRYPDRQILDDVIPRLHAVMQTHTGGDWQAFMLTVNKDGSVTTKFEYS